MIARMTAPWPPLLLFAHPRRVNRSLVGGIDEDTAPVVAAAARLEGYTHAFVVAHVGRTTQVQMIVWPMRLAPEPTC